MTRVYPHKTTGFTPGNIFFLVMNAEYTPPHQLMFHMSILSNFVVTQYFNSVTSV